jgi:hypothetical protein
MVYARKLILLSAVALILVGPPACADLLFDHFGVTLELGAAQTDTINGGTYTPFASGTFAPTRHTDTVDYVVDDWYGSWDFTDVENQTSGSGAGVVPSGAEPYDVEALYFDDSASDLLIVIVTSFDPPPGHAETRIGGDPLVVTGDLAIDLGLNSANPGDGFHYDFGVNINNENRPSAGQNATSGGTAIGDDLYRTGNADWYVGTDANDVPAGGELTNFDPNWGSFGGSYLGDASVSYYEYDFGGGALECRYATYIIEVMVPRTLLPHLESGDTLDIAWVEGCRNDGNTVDACLRFDDPPDVDVPEPGTLLLMGLGTLGMGWWRRRKLAE